MSEQISDERILIRGTLCYATYGNQMPMVFRNKDPKDFHYMKYVAPGGKLELGETLDQCVSREVLEEFGVNLKTFRRIGTVFFNNLNRTFNGKAKNFDYLCEVYAGELESLPTATHTDNGNKIEIFPSAQISSLPQHECDLEILSLVQRNRTFQRLEFLFSGEKLVRMILDYGN